MKQQVKPRAKPPAFSIKSKQDKSLLAEAIRIALMVTTADPASDTKLRRWHRRLLTR